ncbi:MAG TPA: hypothetical protein VFE91_01895, partial [Nitrososphaerales archaeon]|nr:hypothetical protein [Nitrososphaerales archaeon]
MQEKEVVMAIYDEKRGELLGTGGEDYVMISAEALRKINKQEQLMLGSGSFVIWYNSGRAVGQEDGKRFAPLMDTMEIDKFAGYLRDTYSRYGWGQIEYGDVDLKSGELLFR